MSVQARAKAPQRMPRHVQDASPSRASLYV